MTEPFNREKIVRGVRRACQGRPVTDDELAILAQRVEEVIRSRGLGEIPSQEVGLAILGPLRALDEVAYLRFASVYRSFESLADFEGEIAALRTAREEASRDGQRHLEASRDDTGGDGAHRLDDDDRDADQVAASRAREWLPTDDALVPGWSAPGSPPT